HLPSWTITKYEVDLGSSVARGYFSNVYKGTWRRRTVAVKVLESHIPSDLLNEVNIWMSLRHRIILRFYGASSTKGPLPWFIVSPFVQHGSVSDYLKRMRKRADLGVPQTGKDEPNFLQLTYDVGNGMKYLHRMGILHCDLKTANVLVDDKKRCLIADFGQSKLTSEVTHETPAPKHALRWQAPEVMHNRSIPTRKVDVYSFAMVCVEIITMGSIP
ncbi:kinase-like domain-containing protein, partial [Collybia nuda]